MASYFIIYIPLQTTQPQSLEWAPVQEGHLQKAEWTLEQAAQAQFAACALEHVGHLQEDEWDSTHDGHAQSAFRQIIKMRVEKVVTFRARIHIKLESRAEVHIWRGKISDHWTNRNLPNEPL